MADPVVPVPAEPAASNPTFTIDLSKPQDVDRLVDMLKGQKDQLGTAAAGASAMSMINLLNPKAITPQNCSDLELYSQMATSSTSTIGQIADILARPDVARMTQQSATELKSSLKDLSQGIENVLEGPKATCQKFGA